MSFFLVILGTPPPPRGGVTTHVERLLPYLEAQGIPYELWQYRRGPIRHKRTVPLIRRPWRVFSALGRPGPTVLHAPISRVTLTRALFFLLLRLLGFRLTITLVASPEQTLAGSTLNQIGLRLLAWTCRWFVSTGPFKKRLLGLGLAPDQVRVVPPFIPPRPETIDRMSVPLEVRTFMEAHSPLIVTYANGPDEYNGEDLYGLDLLVDLVRSLVPEHPGLGMVVAIPAIDHEARWRVFTSRVEGSGLADRFCYAIGDHFPLVAILETSDLFLRATNTDGDATSLREALALDVPVAASDASPRPEGVVLFRKRDTRDMRRAVAECLARGSHPHRLETASGGADHFLDFFNAAAG